MNDGDSYICGFDSTKQFEVFTSPKEALAAPRVTLDSAAQFAVDLPYLAPDQTYDVVGDWLGRCATTTKTETDGDTAESTSQNASDAKTSTSAPAPPQCCRPWVSYGSATSVTLNWLPPLPNTNRFDRQQFKYRVFQCKLQAAPASGKALPKAVNAAKLAKITPSHHWQECTPKHTGFVYSHIVSDLECGVRGRRAEIIVVIVLKC